MHNALCFSKDRVRKVPIAKKPMHGGSPLESVFLSIKFDKFWVVKFTVWKKLKFFQKSKASIQNSDALVWNSKSPSVDGEMISQVFDPQEALVKSLFTGHSMEIPWKYSQIIWVKLGLSIWEALNFCLVTLSKDLIHTRLTTSIWRFVQQNPLSRKRLQTDRPVSMVRMTLGSS